MDGFCESPAKPRPVWVFQIGLGGVTPGVGWRYAGGWVALRRGLGGVTPGVGWRYAGAFGLLISHLPFAYSFTVQPTAASSASALRAVWRRVFIVLAFAVTSGQI